MIPFQLAVWTLEGKKERKKKKKKNVNRNKRMDTHPSPAMASINFALPILSLPSAFSKPRFSGSLSQTA
jgi:hypothetical protein